MKKLYSAILLLVLLVTSFFAVFIRGECYSPSFTVSAREDIDPFPKIDSVDPVKPDNLSHAPKSAKLSEALDRVKTVDCAEDYCQFEWSGWLYRPFIDPDQASIDRTYPYASRGNGSLAIHHGVEFPNPHGTPVWAAGDGEVIFAGRDDLITQGPYRNFYGNLIIIRHRAVYHGENLYTLYGHLSKIYVKEGDLVNPGDTIGEVGTSGVAIGSHLHFEVRYKQNDYHHTTNPVLWFSPLTASGLNKTSTLAGLVTDNNGYPLPQKQITIQRLNDKGIIEKTYYFKTYALYDINRHPELDENFVMPDLPPGRYRLSLVSEGLYEKFFTLEPGKLTYLVIKVD